MTFAARKKETAKHERSGADVRTEAEPRYQFGERIRLCRLVVPSEH